MFNIYNNSKNNVKASYGIMDLTTLDLGQSNSIPLEGQWRVYPNQLLEPNSVTDFGKNNEYVDIPFNWKPLNLQDKGKWYATFVLKVNTKDENVMRALRVPSVDSAYKLWVDDELIMSKGEVGKSISEEIPLKYPDTRFFLQRKKEFTIVMQISNFSYRRGGFLENIEFGNEKALIKKNNIRLVTDVVLTTTFFILAIYNLLFFIFNKKDKTKLYICLASLFTGIRITILGERFIVSINNNFGWEIYNKIEYLSLCFFIISLMKYFKELYDDKISRVLELFIYSTSIIYVICILVFRSAIFTSYINIYQGCIGIALFYIFYILLNQTIYYNESSVVLGGYIFLMITGINDILYYNGFVKTGQYMSIGLFVFIVTQVFSIYIRLSKNYSCVENKSDRLALLDKLKDDFIENISKEIKSSLTMIAEISKSMLNEKDEDNIIQNLKVINDSSMDLIEKVKDLGDYSKIQDGKISTSNRIVDIRQILDLIYELIKSKLVEKNIELKIDIPQNLVLVYVDENRFQKILLSIIQDRITQIDNSCIEVRAQEYNNMIKISISEVKKKYEKIIKKLGSRNKEGSHNKLEMELAKVLLNFQGGYLKEIDSNIEIYIPKIDPLIRDNFDVAKEKKHEQLNPEGEFKILIADDDFANIQIILSQLASQDYSITVVDNGIDALKELRKEDDKFDLLVLDSMMPRMSGFKVCKIIRKKYSAFDLPIIMMMNKDFEEEINLAFDIGANDYIIKPFFREELQSKIKTLLSLKDAVEHAVMNAKLFGEVKQLAITDSLTGINNRRYFFETSEEEFRKAKEFNDSLSVIMVDLDHFKNINDEYGHHAGDMVLKEVASICKLNLRSGDILGRYGGEEFIITLLGTGIDEAYNIAERLRKEIEQHTIKVSGKELKVTISLGLQELKEYHASFKDIILEADKALYEVKNQGRNSVKKFNS